MTYDAIVIGARAAGSPTAMLLARKGYRVLAVDRATFPSDTLSTHVIHAPGVAALQRWGLLDEVMATGCPAITGYSFDFGAVHHQRHQPAGRRHQRRRTPRVAPCSTRSWSTPPARPASRSARTTTSTRSSSRTAGSSGSGAATARSGPASSSARTAATAGSPRPSARRTTTPSRGCSTPTSPTSAACPPPRSRATSGPTEGSRARRPTTG